MAVATLGQVEPFDLESDDWVLYTERLEQFFVANAKVDNKKVAVLLTVIGAKAYSLLRNLLAPTKPADTAYADLVKVMKDHFKPKPIVIAERFKFHRWDQQDEDNVAQYLAELRRLTEQCDFKEYLEEALRDRFVCGLRSVAIQRRLLAEEDLNLKKAFDLANGMEAANRKASELQASTKTGVAARDIQHVAPPKPESASAFPPCYRYGKTGHSPDSCYFKLQKCRGCGKKGHIAKMCRSANPEPRTFTKSRHGRQKGRRVGFMDQEVIPNKKDEVTDENLFTVRMVSGTNNIIVRPEMV